MIEGLDSVSQALLGTLLTWYVTALGSAVVFLFPQMRRKPLDASLGFAAGVMMAASYWSLLEPSIETARSLGYQGNMLIFPTCTGFVLGAFFVLLADYVMPSVDYSSVAKKNDDFDLENASYHSLSSDPSHFHISNASASNATIHNGVSRDLPEASTLGRRQGGRGVGGGSVDGSDVVSSSINWKRILLLIIAITVHNIPEGMAVGVSFGSIGKTETCTFAKSRNLAIGIAIQNFPEGIAVSIPLKASGVSSLKAFWYGQLSGMVEPMAGVLGALGVSLAEPVLPYVLAFAAGAMVFVVFDDIIPEAHTSGNGRTASIAAIFGFVVMMALDVVLE